MIPEEPHIDTVRDRIICVLYKLLNSISAQNELDILH